MAADDRGIWRGSCLQVGCDCSSYSWDSSNSSLKCTNCGHPPGRHQKVSEVTSHCDNLHNTAQNDRTKPPYKQEGNVEWSEDNFPRSESLKELALLSPKEQDPQQLLKPRLIAKSHMSQRMQVSTAVNLKCLGCNRQKWRRDDGTYYDYCGKTCRDLHKKNVASVWSATGSLQCPGCGRMKYSKGDGTYYDYCSKRCRDAYQSQHPLQLGTQPQAYLVPVPCGSSEHTEVSTLFQNTWCFKKGQSPGVDFIFRIQAASVTAKWQAYRCSLTNNYVERHFHGTTLSCNMAATQQLCSQAKCGICGISKNGFVSSTIGSKIRFQRFGHGFYLAPNSSKCHDYTEGACGYRAMLLCEVCPGRKHKIKHQNTALVAPPQGYDSVYGMTGGELNYEEITIYNSDALLPKYIILYTRDNINRLIP